MLADGRNNADIILVVMPSSDALCQPVHIGMKLKISWVGSYMSTCVPSTLLNELKRRHVSHFMAYSRLV